MTPLNMFVIKVLLRQFASVESGKRRKIMSGSGTYLCKIYLLFHNIVLGSWYLCLIGSR